MRIAILVSHPIQYFAPWYRAIAALPGIVLKVFFCKERGLKTYLDRDFGVEVKWDIPLLEGYDHEFLPGSSEEKGMGFFEIDNPSVADALAQFQPDVLLVHGYVYRTVWRACRWCNRRKVPVMLISDSNASAVRAGWKSLLKRLVVRHFYRGLSGAFVTGDNNRAYHRQYGLPEERLFTGTMPVDVLSIRASVSERPSARQQVRQKLAIPEDAFVAMFAGKLVDHKSAEHLVEAVHLSAQSGRNVWGVLVGEGRNRPAIEQYIANHRIKNVKLTGFVNQSAIGTYYAAADVLCLLSSYEPKGLVVPEAGSFGLPAIVSDRIGCIGPNDSARVGENALVYPWGNISALSGCINQLYDDPELYRKMSEKSLTIADEQDARVAARMFVEAATALKKMGPRR